jgi:uncharacterized protein YndB with AHSA1/START domain
MSLPQPRRHNCQEIIRYVRSEAMPSITNTIDIKATPEQVWTVLGDMPATRSWLPGVVAARMEGDVRICQMADGQEIHEQISDIDPQHSYRFRHLRVPLPVAESAGRFTVTAGPTAGTATVTLDTTFTPLDPSASDDLTTMISSAFQQSLESLRRFVEDDTSWDA